MDQSPVIERYFACIGAQKAGTTWLARVLSRHDDVFVTPVKEIHYFDHIEGLTEHLSPHKRRSRYRKYHQRMWTQWHRWREYRAQAPWYRAYMKTPMDDAWYASLFAERGGKTVAGEATPEYALIGKAGLRHMLKLAPDAHLIYIMRNPVTRSWSQLLHQCRVRKRDAATMSTAELLAIAEEDRFQALADYVRVIAAVEASVPSGQMLYMFYEDVHADRMAALERVCTFLGVGFDADRLIGLDKRYNPSQLVRMPADLRKALRIKYRPMVREVERRLGQVPTAWRRDFNLPSAC
jgi:hypothetical protein